MASAVPLRRYPAPPRDVPPGQVAVTSSATRRSSSAHGVRCSHHRPGVHHARRSRSAALGRAACGRRRSPSSDLPPLDLVLVSHNHYDHLQPSSLRPCAVARPAADRDERSVCIRSGRRAALRERHELDWWQITDDMRQWRAITAVPGAALLGADAVGSQPDALVRLRRRASTASRSTSPATPATRRSSPRSGARFPSIDLALLPIGAYEPRWFMRRCT